VKWIFRQRRPVDSGRIFSKVPAESAGISSSID
jgi:hypothetical protein